MRQGTVVRNCGGSGGNSGIMPLGGGWASHVSQVHGGITRPDSISSISSSSSSISISISSISSSSSSGCQGVAVTVITHIK